MWTLLLVWLLLGDPAGAATVDRVVVVVEDQLVLASEVRFEAVLATLDVSPIPFWSAGHGTPLERLVQAAAVRHVAGDVTLHQPTTDEVRARLEAVRAHFPDRGSWAAFLATWGLDEALLEGVLRRRMVVERYLARNVAAPPDDGASWLAEADLLLDRLRGRLRIRTVPLFADAPR